MSKKDTEEEENNEDEDTGEFKEPENVMDLKVRWHHTTVESPEACPLQLYFVRLQPRLSSRTIWKMRGKEKEQRMAATSSQTTK